MKKLRIGIALFLVIALIGYLVYQEGSLPVDRTNKNTQMFVIQKGEGLNGITKRLHAEGLIRNKVVFYLIAKQLGIERSIQAGDFRLSKSLSASEVAKSLTQGTVDEWVTIIEGVRKEEIAEQLATQFGISEVEFIEKAREGTLFPDTYLIPKGASVETIITILNNNFSAKLASARSQARFNTLSDQDALILASLVEREARLPDDRRLVASIILKRLKNDWPLQIDATIQYALGYQKKEGRWWKKELTLDDLKVDSTYNTYERTGLPPTPICNPSLDALRAAFAADPSTPYLFYVSDKGGVIRPGRTLEEHNRNIKKYIGP